jgi:hypothetical protein
MMIMMQVVRNLKMMVVMSLLIKTMLMSVKSK